MLMRSSADCIAALLGFIVSRFMVYSWGSTGEETSISLLGTSKSGDVNRHHWQKATFKGEIQGLFPQGTPWWKMARFELSNFGGVSLSDLICYIFKAQIKAKSCGAQ